MIRTGSACVIAAVVASPALAGGWDEGVDGDLSNDTLNPTVINLDLGSNIVTGTVGGANPGEFVDAMTFNIGAGQSLEAITLVSYVTAGGNTSSGFNLHTGTSWDGVFDGPSQITSVAMTGAFVSTDMLDIDAGGALGPGDYLLGIFEGTPGQAYTFDFVVTPAPGTAALLALGGLGAMRRRR